MKCMKTGCEKTGEKMGTFGDINLVYCEDHKEIFTELEKKVKQAKSQQHLKNNWRKLRK